MRRIFLFFLLMMQLLTSSLVFALDTASTPEATSPAEEAAVDTQLPTHCDTAIKTFQVHSGTRDKLLPLGKGATNETPPAESTTIKNTYVCTKLLEPMPFSVLGTGDFCVTSLWEVQDSKGQENKYMIIKGGGTTITGTGPITSVKTSDIACSMIGVPSGMGAIERYISIVYRWATMFMGIVAVILMVVGGIMITMEGANPDMKGSGKKLIQSAIIAMVLLFLSGAILQMINPVFFT